jgi:hypothetical protein
VISITLALDRSLTAAGWAPRSGRISVEGFFLELCNACRQPGCCSFLYQLIAQPAARQITFFTRRADRFFGNEFLAQCRHLADDVTRIGDTRSRVDYEQRVTVKIDAGILLAHGRDGGYPKVRLNGPTERTGRHPVTAGIEAWTRDKQVYVRRAKLFQNGGAHRLLVLNGVIIAADKSYGYTRAGSQQRFQ